MHLIHDKKSEIYDNMTSEPFYPPLHLTSNSTNYGIVYVLVYALLWRFVLIDAY